MPRRLVARVLLLAAFAAAVAVEVGGAATTDAGLTFNVTPNPIIAGEPVLAYGRLGGPEHGDKKIVLHDRVNPATSFSVEAITTTDTSGFYEFALPDGIVNTSRSWYVTGPGPVRSRSVHERVAAELTLEASAVTGDTTHPLTFTGTIIPAGVHTGEQVSLQQATGSSGANWKTIAQGAIDASSGYSVSRDFHTPGAYEMRVRFAGDAESIAAASDPVTVVVEQAEHPSFTIDASNPAIDAGQTVTISGVLRATGSSSTALAGESVTLWGHAHGAPYTSIASTTTARDGSYSFAQMPSNNGSYQARTTSRRTAPLYEAVHADVTLTASSTSSEVGKSVTFSGSVTPTESGDVIDLEQMGTDGHYHPVQSATVEGDSTYAFTERFGSAGTQTFRAMTPGSKTNANGTSPPVTVKVALPAVETLPTLCVACSGKIPGPTPAPPIPTGTVVTVTAGVPATYTFTLSTATQPKVVSDKPATELTVPTGDVTFNVTDSPGGILSHTFEVCTTPLPGPVTTLAAVQALPDSCSGTTVPPSPHVLAPGASATVTIDFTSPGTYEYLSTVGGAATGDAFAGMKGVLNVT